MILIIVAITIGIVIATTIAISMTEEGKTEEIYEDTKHKDSETNIPKDE